MSGTKTLTESLAGYWSAARYEDLPPETVRLAKRFMLDTLAADRPNRADVKGGR